VTLALLAMSHSPLLEHAELDKEVSGELEAAFSEARRFVHEFDPDVIVNFAPDHYNGFFYRLMPAFCIGYAAESIGDYGSQAGRLDVPEDLARALSEAVIGDGIDLAVSLDMQVDHGAVQPMEIVYGDITAKPFVPVFINSVAPPFTPVQGSGCWENRSAATSRPWTRRSCSSPPAACPMTRPCPGSPRPRLPSGPC
jgi:2,3-dihydroxyphenylpropionate 1,2-dioxygenase